MGLLDMGAQQAQPMGGLLGGYQPQGQGAQPQASGMQMAMELSKNPTPQTAQKIIAQLQQIQNPEADKFEAMLMQVANDPAALKQLADSVIQKLGGGNA